MSETYGGFSLRSLFRWLTVVAVVFAVLGLFWRWYGARQQAYQRRWGEGEVTNRDYWPERTRDLLESIEAAGPDRIEIIAYRMFDGWGHGFFWKLRNGNNAKARIASFYEMQPLAPADPQVRDFWNYVPAGWLPPPGPAQFEMHAWPGIGDASRYILLHDQNEDILYLCDVFDF